jgi:hypothetical protein
MRIGKPLQQSSRGLKSSRSLLTWPRSAASASTPGSHSS